MFLKISTVIAVFFSTAAFSQENFSTILIPQELKENANAVVRLSSETINVEQRNSMKVKEHRVVTVLNEEGMNAIGAVAYYDKTTNVRSIEAMVYDKNGELLKKFKKKDFKDVSVSSDSDITDNRALYLDYTPITYPFTVVFNCESDMQSTAFLPQWSPVERAFLSTMRSERTFTVNPSLGFRYKEYNFGDIKLEKQQNGNTYTFKSENIPAMRSEDASPSFSKVAPLVLFSLEKFHLEGVDGDAPDWGALGKWIYNSLLVGTDELPAETVTKIKALTANETDPLKKAKIVYEYVQGKTRYVSIQLGIGGWKPMNAKDVDRLGYGDCKALTNYTRALLSAVGVPSYYTVVYSGARRRDLTQDFVSMQGDHVILAIPVNNELVWLECTSQKLPFGFQGDFTDNRLVLLVKPDKGELVRTHVYTPKDNKLQTTGSYTITSEGDIKGGLTRVSEGLEYDEKYALASLSPDEVTKYYKNHFSSINNLKLTKTDIKNNSGAQQLTEDLQVEASSYCSNSGGRLIFPLNAFNKISYVPARYRSRKMPLEVTAGYTVNDDITISIPEGYAVEAMPQNLVITDKFGEYKAEYSVAGNQLHFKRTIVINDGTYPKEDYDKYREFRDKIARNENAKAVLVKK